MQSWDNGLALTTTRLVVLIPSLIQGQELAAFDIQRLSWPKSVHEALPIRIYPLLGLNTAFGTFLPIIIFIIASNVGAYAETRNITSFTRSVLIAGQPVLFQPLVIVLANYLPTVRSDMCSTTHVKKSNSLWLWPTLPSNDLLSPPLPKHDDWCSLSDPMANHAQ